MATIQTTDVDLQLFQPTDVYFYTIDNRPLRRLLANDQAINEQLDDVIDKDRYIVSFIVETPSVETYAAGRFIIEKAGEIVQIVVTHGTPGAAGSHVVDILKNSLSCYANPGDRPTLAYNDSDNRFISTPPNLSTTSLAIGDELAIDITDVQTGGSPRWLRVDIFIQPTIVASTAWSF